MNVKNDDTSTYSRYHTFLHVPGDDHDEEDNDDI